MACPVIWDLPRQPSQLCKSIPCNHHSINQSINHSINQTISLPFSSSRSQIFGFLLLYLQHPLSQLTLQRSSYHLHHLSSTAELSPVLAFIPSSCSDLSLEDFHHWFRSWLWFSLIILVFLIFSWRHIGSCSCSTPYWHHWPPLCHQRPLWHWPAHFHYFFPSCPQIALYLLPSKTFWPLGSTHPSCVLSSPSQLTCLSWLPGPSLPWVLAPHISFLAHSHHCGSASPALCMTVFYVLVGLSSALTTCLFHAFPGASRPRILFLYLCLTLSRDTFSHDIVFSPNLVIFIYPTDSYFFYLLSPVTLPHPP